MNALRPLYLLFALTVAILGNMAAFEPVYAGGVREPVVPNVRPQPRAVPTPRITPRPQFAPAPRVAPGSGARTRPGPGINPSQMRPQTLGRECFNRCGSQCQSASCSGLDPAQCSKVRQQCRLSCRSGCR